MIRVIKQQGIVTGDYKYYYEYAGLSSTDTKPTDDDIATGSIFLEVDTGDVYAYDEVGETWSKICALGGSGT